jgi:hypothetical protein
MGRRRAGRQQRPLPPARYALFFAQRPTQPSWRGSESTPTRSKSCSWTKVGGAAIELYLVMLRLGP